MKQERNSNRAPSRSTVLRSELFAIALVILLLVGVGLSAQQPKASESEIEAIYVFKFSQFITWPANARTKASFDICVLGDDPVGPNLDRTIHGETVDGRIVVDRHITRPQDAQGCSILYISRSEAFRLRQILADLREWPVLTVSDMTDFVDKGGMIQFVLQNGRVRFEVNLAPATQAGLSFSSELLKVAVDVKGATAQGGH